MLQNFVMRIETEEPMGTPTTSILKWTKTLSVHQLVEFQTLMMVNKVITISKPPYLAKRLKLRVEDWGIVPGRSQATILPTGQTLSVTKGVFVSSLYH